MELIIVGALAATPAVLFTVERGANLVNKRAAELNTSIDNLLASGSISASKPQKPDPLPEEGAQQTPEETNEGESLGWRLVDQAEHLAIQRAQEIKKLAEDLLAPEKQEQQARRPINYMHRQQQLRARRGASRCDPASLSEHGSPQPTDSPRLSKVSFDGAPDVSYIFLPAGASARARK